MIEQRGRTFALVQTDLGGLPYALTQEVLNRVADLGITGERLLLSATHTHSSTGPIWPADSSGYALLGGDAFDPRAFEITVQGVVEAIRAAHSNLESARIGTAVAELRGASRNRAFDAFRRNPDVPAGRGGGARGLDRPRGARDSRRRRRRAADRRLVELRDPSHLVRRREPALLGRQSGYGRAGGGARHGRRGRCGGPSGRSRPPAGERVDEREPGRHLAGRRDRTATGTTRFSTCPTASPRPTWRERGSARGCCTPGARAGASMADEIAIDARRVFLPFDGTPADGEPVGPLEVLGNGGIVADDGTCAPFDNFAGPGQGMKFPLLAGASAWCPPRARCRSGASGASAWSGCPPRSRSRWAGGSATASPPAPAARSTAWRWPG